MTPRNPGTPHPTAREPLLTMNEVMERLRIGRRTMRYLIDRDPDFVTCKLGHRRLMTPHALDAFIRAKEHASRPMRGGSAWTAPRPRSARG